MRDLKEIRDDIDRIDGQLAILFKERMDLGREAAVYKRAHGLPIYDPEREKEILERRTKALQDGDDIYSKELGIFYQTLMDLSKQVQARLSDDPEHIHE